MDVREFNRYLADRPDDKIFRVHGDAFADDSLLELGLEFRHIFEKHTFASLYLSR